MNKSKLRLTLHLVAQILAQGAVIELIPVQYKPLLSAFIAIIGVLVAFFDQSVSTPIV